MGSLLIFLQWLISLSIKLFKFIKLIHLLCDVLCIRIRRII